LSELRGRLLAMAEPLVVLSGGQTGVDQLALHEAVSLGLPAVAIMPRGRRVDSDVPAPSLAPGIPEHVPVHELPGDEYRARTWTNAWLCDVTLLWDLGGGGVEETRAACRHHGRPLYEMPRRLTPDADLRIVQVAGSRARYLTAADAPRLRREIADALRQLLPDRQPL
jgi:hypothetical protein